MATFDANYPQNLWANITNKTRDWYVADLYRIFFGQAVYNNFVNVKFNMNGLGATQMFIDNPIMPHTSTDAIGARDLWLDTSFMDSARRAITFSQYGGKFSYHKYDEMITYWKQNGVRGLRRLIDEGMGYQITWTLEKLARNAMLSNSYATYGSASGTKFDTIASTDKMTTAHLRSMWRDLKRRGAPYAQDSSFQVPGSVFCITSPDVVADLLEEADAAGSAGTRALNFLDVSLYTGNVAALNGEVGTYQRVRFVETNNAILYNCGDITSQTNITAPITAGDGAPDPATTAVDGVFLVGQPGADHSITVTDSSGFAVGDILSIHKLRTSANGVTNGVDFTDSKLHNLRVVDIPDGTHVSFASPVMVDFTTEVTSGVYGYVTKGRHVHSAVFMAQGQDGVVNGIMQPPLLHQPDPVDDRQAQFRFTWDAYLKYQLFNPGSFAVRYYASSF